MILEHGLPDNGVFMFQENQRKGNGNGDYMQSINWEDDHEAITFTLSMRHDDGTPQFKGGVAILEKVVIDQVAASAKVAGALSYERESEEGNRYHGNLLLKPVVSKYVMRSIAADLALRVSRIVPMPLE